MKNLSPKLISLSFLPAIALPALALAQTPSDVVENSVELPVIVVTASRQAENAENTAAATRVYTREDIERLQPGSLPELLGRTAGIQIKQNGGLGSLTGLYVRGTKSAQTLVMVDGVRLNGADSGMAMLEALSLEQIERIEVVRGPRSSIYGSDAIGGVIQIFTRKGSSDGLQPYVRLGYGSHQTWERSAGVSGGNEHTRFSLALSSDDTRGIDRTTHPDTGADGDRDAYRNDSVSLALSHQFSDWLEAGLNVLDQRGESEYDNAWPGAYPYDDFQLSTFALYTDLRVTDIWQVRLDLGRLESRRFNKFDDVADKSNFNTYRDSATLINTLAVADNQALLVGADWYDEALSGGVGFAETERWNRAAFIQHQYDGEHFSTELGLRHDDNEVFGSENSWNGALILPLSPQNKLVLSYGEGFRAPTFVDLYYPGYDNPDLKPERSKTYELQWRSQLGATTHLQTSVYRTDLKDAIVTDASFTPQNIGSARINGLEVALRHQWQDWQGTIEASIINPVDRETDKLLNRRSKRTLNLDLDRIFGNFSVGGNWQLVSRSWDDPANANEIRGYGLLGLRATWQAHASLRIALKVDNVLDKDYSESLYSVFDPVDFSSTNHPYREAGRTAMLSLLWQPDLR